MRGKGKRMGGGEQKGCEKRLTWRREWKEKEETRGKGWRGKERR